LSILIVDGVTGAGKTSVLGELRRQWSGDIEFIEESNTLGDLMNQIRDPVWRANPTFEALDTVLARLDRTLAAEPQRHIVVERFQLTAFALFPDWSYYERFDERLRELGAVIVLLTFPPEQAEVRAVRRIDRDPWDTGMDAWYGSRLQAVEAVVDSQCRRWEGLSKTRLPFLHIDTRDQEWRRYAATIIAYWMGA
jgi:hypothetical protein